MATPAKEEVEDYTGSSVPAMQGAPSSVGMAPEPVASEDTFTREGILIPSWMETPVRGVRQLVHGASLGADKKLMAVADSLVSGKTYEQEEAKHLKNLAEDRDSLGLLGTGLEVAGMVASPIARFGGGVAKGLGYKGIPSLLQTAGKATRNPHTLLSMGEQAVVGGIKGAATGSLFGLASHLAENSNQDIRDKGLEGLNDPMLTGGKWGGAFGATAGALRGYLTARKPELEMKAIAATRADAEYPGKASMLGRASRIKKLDDVAQYANEHGITGGLFQTPETTLQRASSKVGEVGKVSEGIRNQISAKAGTVPVGDMGTLRSEIMNDLASNVLKGRQPGSDIRAGLKAASDELTDLFHRKAKGTITLDDVYSAYRTVKDQNHGIRGDRILSQTVPNKIQFELQSSLMDTFRKYAKGVDPKLAKELEQLDHHYHMSKTLEDMAASGKMGELGARNFMGRILGLGASMLPVGPLGKVAVGAGVNKLTQRTVLPNTGLWLLNRGNQVTNPVERVLGYQAGKPE